VKTGGRWFLSIEPSVSPTGISVESCALESACISEPPSTFGVNACLCNGLCKVAKHEIAWHFSHNERRPFRGAPTLGPDTTHAHRLAIAGAWKACPLQNVRAGIKVNSTTRGGALCCCLRQFLRVSRGSRQKPEKKSAKSTSPGASSRGGETVSSRFL